MGIKYFFSFLIKLDIKRSRSARASQKRNGGELPMYKLDKKRTRFSRAHEKRVRFSLKMISELGW